MPARIRLSKTLAVIALFVSSLVISGCHSEAPIAARGETYPYPWLMLGSGELSSQIRAGDAKPIVDESNLLHVIVPIRNTTDHDLKLISKFIFRDRDGAEVNSIDSTVDIPARGLKEITGNATSPRATDYRVELHTLKH